MKTTTHLLLCAACLAATGMPGAAEIHKWVDENGVTVYSQTAPAGNPSTKVNTPAAPPGTEAARAELAARIERLEKAQAARENAATEKAAEADRLAAREDECSRSRAQLAALESGPPRKLLVGPDGTARRLSYEELQEEIAKTREDIKDRCNGL